MPGWSGWGGSLCNWGGGGVIQELGDVVAAPQPHRSSAEWGEQDHRTMLGEHSVTHRQRNKQDISK